MGELEKIIEKVRILSGCRVLKPHGLPMIDETKHILPEDLKEFYSLCGGLVLFEDDEYPIYISSPENLVLANPVIVGELYEEDISSDWYIIGNNGENEFLTIDLNVKRQGRCYDSFFDRHGVVGESQIIATSFSDLLERLITNKGQHWYWLKENFGNLGDAYDEL